MLAVPEILIVVKHQIVGTQGHPQITLRTRAILCLNGVGDVRRIGVIEDVELIGIHESNGNGDVARNRVSQPRSVGEAFNLQRNKVAKGDGDGLRSRKFQGRIIRG